MRTYRGCALLYLLAAGLLCGCAGFVDEDEGQVPITEFTEARKGQVGVTVGWLDGKKVEFYRFEAAFQPGSTSWFPSYTKFPGLPVGDMYVLNKDNSISLEGSGQHPIIDVLPRQARYTDFFELVAFSPDGDYTANDIKSRATLKLAGYKLTRTGGVVHCPVVGPDASLATPRGTPLFIQGREPIKVWYRKKLTHCFLLEGGAYLRKGGGSPLTVSRSRVGAGRTLLSVPAAEVYTMLTSAFSGADRVSNIPVPGNDIFRYGPGDTRYSPVTQIWDVTVPGDYKVGARTSYGALFPVKDFTDPGIVKRNPDTFSINTLITVGTAQ